MFFDYFHLYGTNGAPPTFDFMWRLLFIVVVALILAIVGFKVRQPWGAAFPLLYGIFVYLVNR